MQSRLLTILLLYVGCQNVIAQSGNYFLSHYAPAAEKVSYPSFDMVQGKTGVIYFAGQSGVMKFDGRNWDLISTKGAVYTLGISEKNDIYLGGLNGFGKTGIDEYGLPNYQSFSTDHDDAKNIFSSLVLTDRAYFLKDSKLFIVNLASEKIEKVIPASSPQNLFTTLFEIQEKVYIGQEDGSLLRVEIPSERGEIKAVKATLPFAPQEEILFTEKSPEGRYLVVAASGRVWINETSTGARELKLKDNAYLMANVVVNGAWVNDELIALGTLRGGILFADPQTGDTQEISNFFTGLPDNEVVSMMGDRSQGLWVAHDYGFTRIAPYLPFRTFNHYSGIEGNLLCAISFHDQVYVGTSLGLYKLNRFDIYEDEVYYVDKPVKGQKAVEPEKAEVAAAQEERAKTKRGLFGFLKKAPKEEKIEPGSAIPVVKNTPQKQTVVRERRIRKVLKGISYAYKKVEGINGKVTQLIDVDGKLAAAGAGGIFEVIESASKTLTNQPVRTIFYSSSLKQVFASTYEDNILTFTIHPNTWTQANLLDTLHDHVSYIFEDHLENIWFCAIRGAYKAETIDHAVFNVEFTPYAHSPLDESVGFSSGNNVYIATSNEFDLYNSAKENFAVYDPGALPKKILASAGSFWFNDGHEWRTFDRKISDAMKLEWLKLFPDIRYLAPTGDNKSLWVITSKNELYKFTAGKADDDNTRYPLFLREARMNETKLAPSETIDIEQLEGALNFEFIEPDFVSGEAVEYRYKVVGLSNDWSDWSSGNNIIPFPLLTPGTYELNVESRNFFGKASQFTKTLIVRPHYWRQPWFYGLEVIFFSALVLLSMQLGAGSGKYRFISRLLSLLTVIMLIQFIQTAAQSLITIRTTPVIDFFIQVGIALVILPLESPLRKFMEESAEGKYELKRLRKLMGKLKR